MSLYIVNSVEASKSQTNYSPAKMTYSFSKTARFPTISPYCFTHFYATKEGVSSRIKRNFGLGKREVFVDKAKTPSPMQYKIESLFDKNKKANIFSFGISRCDMEKNFKKALRIPLSTLPGPGSYKLPDVMGKGVAKYTLHSRSPIRNKKKVPGPGEYELQTTINAKLNVTQFRSTRNVIMKLSTERFPKNKGIVPGPGDYRVPGIDSKLTLSSTLKASQITTLSHETRRAEWIVDKPTPGPGSYVSPSEFGQYESKYSPNPPNKRRRMK